MSPGPLRTGGCSGVEGDRLLGAHRAAGVVQVVGGSCRGASDPSGVPGEG